MSPAKLAANQTNAKLSTGPRSEEGKQTSSRNATRHGLTSKAALLPWESREEYEALHASFRNDHPPVTELENELLRAMADAWWRLQRARRMETEFFIEREAAIGSANEGLSGDTALVLLFTDDEQSRKMRLMMRYIDAAERSWRKAQSDWEQAVAANADLPLPEPEPAEEPKAGPVGFVSQTAPQALPELPDALLNNGQSHNMPHQSHDRKGVVAA